MDGALKETEVFLRKYRKDGPVPAQAAELAEKLEQSQRADSSLPPSLTQLPQELLLLIADLVKPPPPLSLEEDLLESDGLIAKDQHLRHLSPLLFLAQQLVPLLPVPTDPPSRDALDLRARLLLVFGRFTQQVLADVFTTPEARERAVAISSSLFHPPHIRLPLLRHILSTSLPCLFKPHPNLNPSTGRVLSRPLGGDRGIQDWYDEGEDDGTGWRRQAGLSAVVKLVIEGLKPSEVEDLWPLLLPPLLSYLDDYETKNKVLGTGLLDALLERVDVSLLRRTGVGKVFEKSLESCFSTLSDPLTPTLLSSAHPVALKLLDLQYPPHSSTTSSSSDKSRLSALFSLLNTSTLHAWEFKSSHIEIETVTANHLPLILGVLGLSSIRYLQVLVPHLSELLAQTATAAGGTWTRETVEMMSAAAGALKSVVRNGRARMGRWEGRVGGAVAQAWVGLKESDGAEKMTETEEGRMQLNELEDALKAVMKALEEATGGGEVAERFRGKEAVLEGLLTPSGVVAVEA